MNNWLRKSIVILVSILTFGFVTPSQLTNYVNADKLNDRETFEASTAESTNVQTNGLLEETVLDREKFMEELIKQAKIQSYQKFGTKIKPVIEDEFCQVILPNIEKALDQTSAQFPEEDLMNLVITEEPSGGTSEKIFNIKNDLTGKDILRFHVRRDNPPREGFWFNFHYHTYHDDYQTHHDLGSIYWDKNTPPKWMS